MAEYLVFVFKRFPYFSKLVNLAALEAMFAQVARKFQLKNLGDTTSFSMLSLSCSSSWTSLACSDLSLEHSSWASSSSRPDVQGWEGRVRAPFNSLLWDSTSMEVMNMFSNLNITKLTTVQLKPSNLSLGPFPCFGWSGRSFLSFKISSSYKNTNWHPTRHGGLQPFASTKNDRRHILVCARLYRTRHFSFLI